MRYGKYRFTRKYARESALPRFKAKIEKDPKTGCWNWTGCLIGGYGNMVMRDINSKSFTVKTHRFAYIIKHGKDPVGMDMDHLCKNKRCCNPKHLEAVTHSENILRGDHQYRGKKMAPELCEKNRQAQLKRWAAMPASKRREISRKTGRKILGQKRTPEQRARMSAAQLKRFRNEEG